MIYLKLSIRNAKRSFTDYLLYAAAMAVLLAMIEVSNCIATIGELAGFQVISLPLLIAAAVHKPFSKSVYEKTINKFIFS